jgi:hypothetical protein
VDPIKIRYTDSLTLRTADNLRAAYSVSIIGSFQSVSSTQSEEIVALKQQYRQLSVNYKQLCQLVMDMRSQMSSTCAPLFKLYGPGNDQSPPPPPAPPLF